MKRSTLFTAILAFALASLFTVASAAAEQQSLRSDQTIQHRQQRDYRNQQVQQRTAQNRREHENSRGQAMGERRASPWAVGQSLGYYHHRFEAVDYRLAQLAQPAQGQRWVRDTQGDFLLINRSGRVQRVVLRGEPNNRVQ